VKTHLTGLKELAAGFHFQLGHTVAPLGWVLPIFCRK